MKKRVKIGTIDQELARCRAAFRKHPKAALVWCCHHQTLVEENVKRGYNGLPGWKERIDYILKEKMKREQARRFLNYRPVKNKAMNAAYRAMMATRRRWYENSSVANLRAKDKAWSQWNEWQDKAEAIHNREWPRNTWTHRFDGSIGFA